MALHGEEVVMILFIFFVFADPIDGYAGMYQLEYTATCVGAARLPLTCTGAPRYSDANGWSESKTRIYQYDGSTRTAATATAAAIPTAATSTAANQRQRRTQNKSDHQLPSTEYD